MTPIVLSLLLSVPEGDVVFRALEDELSRARTLKMSKAERPYYAVAFYNEEESFHASASFGALQSRGRDRRGQLSAHVRVGSMKLDNTNFAGGDGSGRSFSAPAEPDYDALRQALWLRFDEAYKSALETIAKKRAYLETTKVEDRPDDFAPARVESLVQPYRKLEVDEERWVKLVKRASAVFRAFPLVQAGTVSMRASVAHQTMVSTDPAHHRFGESTVQLTVSAQAQAPDGMELFAQWKADGRSESELPSDERIVEEATKVAKRLEALARAPVAAEDYTGPVLFVGRAAGIFFLQTIGEPLSRPRDELGGSRQGRLVDRAGKHVTRKFITVRDDPNQTAWKGVPLFGHFPVDDDGVKPSAITLVDKGVLKTYFMSRVPTKKVRESNGHSRAGHGQVGNLFVETSEPTPRQALKMRLLKLAAEEDLEYGLMIEELDEGRLPVSLTNVQLPPPLVAWRIYHDGREMLERGASFKPANFRVLKDIEALGDEPTVVNTSHRGQQVSVVAPAVLVRLLELQRTREEFEKPPLLARPPLAAR